ncbi:hypothetical protein UFOVP77_45 [uncultured Caudovirales phage]|uniref:Uncharacterized protein n=1 Tax=uncultured Caudovirales phage TaxID=2100421 RepID=A0A6J5L547_9CAUD|nr:hypothetical protein UFOVP77_45 [uncultured Caudovirales phage]
MIATTKELELITKLATSCYQGDDENPTGILWAECEIESKEEGGVLSSLIKKGLAGFQKNPKEDGANRDYVWLTDAGVELYKSPLNFLKASI